MSPLARFSAAVSFLLLTGFLFGAIEQHGAFSEQAAAWAQALGTVAAISVAIWTTRRASLIAERHAADARFHKVAAMLALFHQLKDAITEAERVRFTGAAFEPANLDSITRGLEQIPPLDVPTGGFAVPLIQATRGLFFYRTHLELWNRCVESHALVSPGRAHAAGEPRR